VCWLCCRLLVLCSAAVYDVTRRETLESLSGSWMAELESYQPHPHVARMVVANKVDAVRRFEGHNSAEFVCCMCLYCLCGAHGGGQQGGRGETRG
jgi:hypothetical protein